MKTAIWGCEDEQSLLLPPGVQRLETLSAIAAEYWDVLALTGRINPTELPGCCRILVTAGDRCPRQIRAESVISYGLSLRDSLTFSGIKSPVLCIQRRLIRPDGGLIEPQELPLPLPPYPAESILPVLGLWLLLGEVRDDCIPTDFRSFLTGLAGKVLRR